MFMLKTIGYCSIAKNKNYKKLIHLQAKSLNPSRIATSKLQVFQEKQKFYK